MDLIGFALAVLLIELTPGPNMAWIVALSLQEGRRAGLAAISGVALGLILNACLSVLGATFILSRSDGVVPLISFLGAAMMTYLAWQAWHQAGDSSAATRPSGPEGRNLVAGFFINLLNPKAALFFITVMPQFVNGGRPTYLQGITLAATSVGIATAIHLLLVLGASGLRPLVQQGERARTIRRALAILMLGVAGWFLVKGLR